MNKDVVKLFSRLEDSHHKLLLELDRIEAKNLELSPVEGKWSVTQIMYHLNSAESNSVLYVSKKRLGSTQLKTTGIEAQLRLIIAWLSFYLPFKYKAPRVLGEMPEYVNYSEIKSTWLETRKKLSALLELLPEDELRKPIFRQPFFGRWNIFQMLWFMQIHFNRHQLQMRWTIEGMKK
ncbi:MAG: DinB family protein [Bacteroidia bacterium]|nr:DinB family protein [Bacteroidia bacterium]